MQMPLFPLEEITIKEFLPEDIKKIEDIALDVAERSELIYGEPYKYSIDETVSPFSFEYVKIPEERLKLKRLDKIISFLSEEPSNEIYYTIRHGQEIIGFTVWKKPSRILGSPTIELAFLHPDFRQKEYALKILHEHFERYSKYCQWC